MRTYIVALRATIPYYTEIPIEANSAEEAERLIRDHLRAGRLNWSPLGPMEHPCEIVGSIEADTRANNRARAIGQSTSRLQQDETIVQSQTLLSSTDVTEQLGR